MTQNFGKKIKNCWNRENSAASDVAWRLFLFFVKARHQPIFINSNDPQVEGLEDLKTRKLINASAGRCEMCRLAHEDYRGNNYQHVQQMCLIK